MHKHTLHIMVRIAVLFIFSVYAVSPIYISARINAQGTLEACQSPAKGIVWVKIVLSALSNHNPDDINDDGVPDHTHVLVKKKRATIRAEVHLKPIYNIATLLAGFDDIAIISSHALEFPAEPRHHETDGYRSLNSGLSPPSLLS